MDLTLTFPPFLAPRRDEACEDAIRLRADAAFARTLPAGTCIVVQSGRIWLTRSGDANDYFVDAGQSHVLTRAGRVVIESLAAPASFRLQRDAPRARPGFA